MGGEGLSGTFGAGRELDRALLRTRCALSRATVVDPIAKLGRGAACMRQPLTRATLSTIRRSFPVRL